MLSKNKYSIFGRWKSLTAQVLLCGLIFNPGFSFSEEIRYHSGDRRDPFVPVTRKVAIATALKGIAVEGIIYDRKGQSLVIIHGEMYKIGDTVEGQKIMAIYPNKIVASRKGSEENYWISGSEEQLAQVAKQKEVVNADSK